MPSDVDLRDLSELTSPDRAFLSVFLSRPRSLRELDRRLKAVRRALKGDDTDVKDEREHFDENVAAVRKYLEDNKFESGSLCLFSCWALDFFRAIPLTAPVKDLVWIDSSPFIRPLAELQDEYENVAVVVADNTKARVFLVSSAIAADDQEVKGNVKNHVKKGGWSQQRYERRRDKQLLLYAREIVDALVVLGRDEDFRRIVLVGGKEILRIVVENLPESMREMVADRAVHLRKSRGDINSDIMKVFFEHERRTEADLWESIRHEYLRGGLGVVGLDDVLTEATAGRVETMVVSRDFHPEGRRCRECENLEAGSPEKCAACNSASLYEVDMVNEIVEMLKQSGAETDFTDPIDTLTQAGSIAALLRYRV